MMAALSVSSVTCRPCAITAPVGLLVEVLPLVADHGIKVVDFCEILHVLGIERQLEVVGVHSAPTVIAVKIGAGTIAVTVVPLLTCREVHSGIHVQVQIFETVNGVVGLNIADETLRGSVTVVQIERSYGVGRSLWHVPPISCAFVGGRSKILHVAAEIVFINGVIAGDGFRRVHTDGSTHNTVSIAVLGYHAFTIDIQLQVVVQQRR